MHDLNTIIARNAAGAAQHLGIPAAAIQALNDFVTAQRARGAFVIAVHEGVHLMSTSIHWDPVDAAEAFVKASHGMTLGQDIRLLAPTAPRKPDVTLADYIGRKSDYPY